MIDRAAVLTETATITVQDGSRQMGAFVARPAGPWPRGGVLVAGELFGLSAHVRDVCERLAAFGYVVLTPDLHHRTVPGIELAHDAAGREQGFALLEQMTRTQVLDDVGAAFEHLRERGCERVAMVGLSVGGHVAYLAATEFDLVAVAVVYGGWLPTTDIPIGRPEATLARTPGITGRVLVLVGELDHVVPPEHRRAITYALRAAGVTHEAVEYPAALHGFLCDRRDTYNPQAADDAWQRLRRLLAAAM